MRHAAICWRRSSRRSASASILRPRCSSGPRRTHPQLRFMQGDVDQLSLNTKFDYVILSDLINDLWDVQTAIERLASVCTPATRVIINIYSRLWELPLGMAARMNLANPALNQNWLTLADLDNMLALGGFEVVRQWQEVLLPLAVPLLAPFCNRYLVKLWPFRHLALTNFDRRPARAASLGSEARGPEPVVSVIVPARNEAGNIENVVRRVPEMGAGTEIVFVEGHSHDDTYAAIEAAIARHPERRMRLLRQSGAGKGDAVRLGFAEASGRRADDPRRRPHRCRRRICRAFIARCVRAAANSSTACASSTRWKSRRCAF